MLDQESRRVLLFTPILFSLILDSRNKSLTLIKSKSVYNVHHIHYIMYHNIHGLEKSSFASSTSQSSSSALYGCLWFSWAPCLRRQRNNAQFPREVLAAQRACKLPSKELSLKVSGTQFRRALDSNPGLFMLQCCPAKSKHLQKLRRSGILGKVIGNLDDSRQVCYLLNLSKPHRVSDA